MKPTVCIDAYNLALTKGTGVATYARNLSHALHDIGFDVEVLYETPSRIGWNDQLKEIAFFDVAAREKLPAFEWLYRAKDIALSLFGHQATRVPITGTVIANQFQTHLPYYDRLWTAPELFKAATAKFEILGLFSDVTIPQRPGIMHWTYPLPIRAQGSKNIYTIHDLVPLRLPHTTLDNKKRHFRLIERLVKEADHIVTVSECSKNDICNLFGVPEDKVTNTYQSVEIPKRLSEKSDGEVKNEIEGAFRLPYKEYFLFYSAIEPKKNVSRLIEAYLNANVKTPLVLVGSIAWLSDSERRLISNYTATSDELVNDDGETVRRIFHIDYVPFSQLVSLIRGAKAVLFPSLYEGFGLPVLESMLLKTPVMGSTQGSIPEVAGDAALLIDPYDISAISHAITALDTNPDLRAELSAKGVKQAALFSSERYKQRLTELYARFKA